MHMYNCEYMCVCICMCASACVYVCVLSQGRLKMSLICAYFCLISGYGMGGGVGEGQKRKTICTWGVRSWVAWKVGASALPCTRGWHQGLGSEAGWILRPLLRT